MPEPSVTFTSEPDWIICVARRVNPLPRATARGVSSAEFLMLRSRSLVSRPGLGWENSSRQVTTAS